MHVTSVTHHAVVSDGRGSTANNSVNGCPGDMLACMVLSMTEDKHKDTEKTMLMVMMVRASNVSLSLFFAFLPLLVSPLLSLPCLSLLPLSTPLKRLNCSNGHLADPLPPVLPRTPYAPYLSSSPHGAS